LAASIRLPPGLSLNVLAGATITACRNGRCTTGGLSMVATEKGSPGWCLQAVASAIDRDFGVRLADCEPGAWSLVLTYDAPSGTTLTDGDRYMFDVRSKQGALVVHWERRVSYSKGPQQPNGEPCKEARVGKLACKSSWPDDAAPSCF
jgi:hypothetical protein